MSTASYIYIFRASLRNHRSIVMFYQKPEKGREIVFYRVGAGES